MKQDHAPPTYIVSVFEHEHWRTVLTTRDKAKALVWAKEIGGRVRVEEITHETDAKGQA